VPGLRDVSIFAGFAFADTPDTCVSFTAVHEPGAKDVAMDVLRCLVAQAWADREIGTCKGEPLDAVLEEFLATPIAARRGPLIVAECSDNIGGGAPGDGTGVLRGLLQYAIKNSLVAIFDPASVAQLEGLPVGARKVIAVGGRGSRYDAGPVEIEVTLLSKSDGRFELEDKQSHLASAVGDYFDMGPCVVVEHDGVTILLTSKPTPPMDLGQWRSQGLVPEKFAVIGVKAAIAHRRAYDPIAWKNVLVETPGPCASDLSSLDFRLVKRPVFPLDLNFTNEHYATYLSTSA
jgi:microcystin degradation protein MlrC